MPKRHHWLYSPVAQCVYQPFVMLYFFLVELPFFGFNARPLDRKAMDVMIQFFSNIKILLVAVVTVAGLAGNKIGKARLLPLRPVVMIASLDLMSRCSAPPLEPVGEF